MHALRRRNRVRVRGRVYEHDDDEDDDVFAGESPNLDAFRMPVRRGALDAPLQLSEDKHGRPFAHAWLPKAAVTRSTSEEDWTCPAN